MFKLFKKTWFILISLIGLYFSIWVFNHIDAWIGILLFISALWLAIEIFIKKILKK